VHEPDTTGGDSPARLSGSFLFPDAFPHRVPAAGAGSRRPGQGGSARRFVSAGNAD